MSVNDNGRSTCMSFTSAQKRYQMSREKTAKLARKFKALKKLEVLHKRVSDSARGVGEDPQTKVLGWDSTLAINTVLTLGDLSDKNFSVDEATQKVVIKDANPEDKVDQWTWLSNRVDVNIRRVDNRLVYTVAGRGISMGDDATDTRHEILRAGIMKQDFRPTEKLTINMRTTPSGSDVMVGEDGDKVSCEIYPTGQMLFVASSTGTGNTIVAPIPMSASHILYVGGADTDPVYGNKEQTINCVNIDFTCRKQMDLIVYTGQGTDTSETVGVTPNDRDNPDVPSDGTNPNGYYVEINTNVGLGDFGPHSTGPTIALRVEDEANSCAFIKIMKSTTSSYGDATVRLYAYSYDLTACPKVKILKSRGVTSSFQDSTLDRNIEWSFVSDYGTFYARMGDADGGNIIYGFNPSLALSAGKVLEAGGMVRLMDGSQWDAAYAPDHRITIDLESLGCFIEIDDSKNIIIRNTSTVPVTLTQTDTTTTEHINNDEVEGVFQQKIETSIGTLILTKNEADIVAEVEVKPGLALNPSPQDANGVVLATASSVDEMFRPIVGVDPAMPEEIIIPLNSTGPDGVDNRLEIRNDGSVHMYNTAATLDASIVPSAAYEKPDEIADQGEITEQKIITPDFVLTARVDGSLVTYEATPIKETITQSTDIIQANEWQNTAFLPEEPVMLELPADLTATGASASYITIDTDGSVDVTAGDKLLYDEDIPATVAGYSVSAQAPASQITDDEVSVSGLMTVHASNIDERTVYMVEPLTANLSATTGTTIGTFSETSVKPEEPVVIEVATMDNDNAKVTIGTDGSVTLVVDSSTTAVAPNTTTTAVSVNDSDSVDEQEITPTLAMLNEHGVRVMANPLSVLFRKIGQQIKCRVKGVNAALTGWVGRKLQLWGPGTSSPVRPTFIPPRFENMRFPVCCKPLTELSTAGKRLIDFIQQPDGSAYLEAKTEAAKSLAIGTEPVSAVKIAQDPEFMANQVVSLPEGSLTRMLGTRAAAGSRLAMWFRKIKSTVVSWIRGQGGISTNLHLGKNTVNIGFDPDMNFGIKVNPGGTGAKGGLTITPNGEVDLKLDSSATGQLSLSKKIPAIAYSNLIDIKADNPDVVQSHYHRTLHQETYGKLWHNVHHTKRLAGEYIDYHELHLDSDYQEGVAGGLFYDVNTHKQLAVRETGAMHVVSSVVHSEIYWSKEQLAVRGIKDFFRKIGQKIKGFVSKIDFKTVLKKGIKAVGTFVTGMVSGKGLIGSGKEAVQEFLSGGLKQFVKPDVPAAVPIKTNEGKENSFSVVGIDGTMDTTSKPVVAPTDVPTTTAFINVADTSTGTTVQSILRSYGMDANEAFQFVKVKADAMAIKTVEDSVTVKAVKYGMMINYLVSTKGANISKGEKILKEKLYGTAPATDISQIIGDGVTITLRKNGEIVLSAIKDSKLSNITVPMSCMIMPRGLSL